MSRFADGTVLALGVVGVLAAAALAPAGSRATSPAPEDMTVKQIQSLLRGAGLTVTDARPRLVSRLTRYLALRVAYGGKTETTLADELTVPDLRALFRQIDWPVSGTKPGLLRRLHSLVNRPLAGRAPQARRPVRIAISWTNPLTGRDEVLSWAYSHASADQILASTRERIRVLMMHARMHLPELAEPDVRLGGGDNPEADGDTLDLLHEISRLEERAMGPALSGNLRALDEIQRRIDRAVARAR